MEKIKAVSSCEVKPGFVDLSGGRRYARILAGVQVYVASNADVCRRAERRDNVANGTDVRELGSVSRVGQSSVR